MDDLTNRLLVHKAQRLISIVASDVFAIPLLYKEQMDVLVKLAMIVSWKLKTYIVLFEENYM